MHNWTKENATCNDTEAAFNCLTFSPSKYSSTFTLIRFWTRLGFATCVHANVTAQIQKPGISPMLTELIHPPEERLADPAGCKHRPAVSPASELSDIPSSRLYELAF